ncbi:prepilin peptidase [Marinobacter sp. M216]|uniref:Prepilin peptidase n=1 Tax=Marinobacter albus TaxID=3030833 RepID=A0ABT7HC94_9GAMM|nr:prepilin peptidase [Marinobacter sp. M216]MDK9557998.1 prepilin peptidase [Marinobacter sp. M216]
MIETNWMFLVLAIALVIAVITDLRTHRIPNWLTFSVLTVALVGQVAEAQWQGLFAGLGGALVGLLCFLPLHIFGAMGAGDVKLMTSVGALLGPQAALIGVLATIVCGGGIALVFIGSRGGLGALWRRYSRMAVMMASRQPVYLAPATGEAAAERFPYALAIACGSFFSIWYLA